MAKDTIPQDIDTSETLKSRGGLSMNRGRLILEDLARSPHMSVWKIKELSRNDAHDLVAHIKNLSTQRQPD